MTGSLTPRSSGCAGAVEVRVAQAGVRGEAEAGRRQVSTGGEATDPDSLLGGAGDSGEGLIGPGIGTDITPPAGGVDAEGRGKTNGIVVQPFRPIRLARQGIEGAQGCPAAAGAKPVS